MEEAQQVKTKRRFPLNLYNRLEQRLKNKSEETPQNTEEAAGIQAEKPQKTEESSLRTQRASNRGLRTWR